MNRRAVPYLLAGVLVALVAVGVILIVDLRPASPTTAPTQIPPTTAVDPYETYLASNPDPSRVLTREDAQARAYLGCGQTFAPGTIDAALADAYRPTGLCG